MEMTGKILFDFEEDRLSLNGDGLHCGDTLQVLIDGEWQDDRVEMDDHDRWYLVNHPDLFPCGLEARR